MQSSKDNTNSVVARTHIDSFVTPMIAAGHELLADEPIGVGGSGMGPSPYDFLAAALASCTSMTLKMYASRKKLDLNAISVAVTHSKIHAEDCVDCETKSGKIDELHRIITLDGNLSEAESQRLLEIADRCPVHRTLHGEISIRSELAE